MASVSLHQVTKNFGRTEVVRGISLEIADGEMLVLVGPSGCGKSTTLRMIAGLESVSGGEIRIGDRRVNDVAPKDRDIAMVFQSYALYPHMTVRQNMEFALKLRVVDPTDRRGRVEAVAQTLGIEMLLERKPRELSGGQRQRVAMGRAIVRRPSVFLFDEPLSNLDAKLRSQMRVELARLHAQLRTTSVYVTHDQLEAMTLADRIVVMRDGIVQQVGTPLELYDAPANRFVAGFIGTPAMNFIDGELADDGDRVAFRARGVHVQLEGAAPPDASSRSRAAVLGVRPSDLDPLRGPVNGEAALPARISVREPLGAEVYLHLDTPCGTLVARVDGHSPLREGDEVHVAIPAATVHIFDSQSGRSLRTCAPPS